MAADASQIELLVDASGTDSVTVVAYHGELDPAQFSLVGARERATGTARRTLSLR